jgi:hypothetical protein
VAKAKAASLAAEVVARARNLKPGPAAWVDALPDDLRQQVLEIKQQHRRGELSVRKYSLARAIRAALTERGFKTANDAGVVHWLNVD